MLLSLADNRQSWLPSVLVAFIALLFALASFWWMNVRQGKLKSYEPQSYAASWSGSSVFLLCLPLVLHNTGPKPIVIQDFKLRFPREKTGLIPIPWRRSRSRLEPRGDSIETMPAVFALPGWKAEQHFIEFGCPFPGVAFEKRDFEIEIQVKLGHKKDWDTLLKFTLRAERIYDPENYETHDNSENKLSKEDKAKLDAFSSGLLKELEERSRTREALPEN
jgi:hypothetical protein